MDHDLEGAADSRVVEDYVERERNKEPLGDFTLSEYNEKGTCDLSGRSCMSTMRKVHSDLTGRSCKSTMRKVRSDLSGRNCKTSGREAKMSAQLVLYCASFCLFLAAFYLCERRLYSLFL